MGGGVNICGGVNGWGGQWMGGHWDPKRSRSAPKLALFTPKWTPPLKRDILTPPPLSPKSLSPPFQGLPPRGGSHGSGGRCCRMGSLWGGHGGGRPTNPRTMRGRGPFHLGGPLSFGGGSLIQGVPSFWGGVPFIWGIPSFRGDPHFGGYPFYLGAVSLIWGGVPFNWGEGPIIGGVPNLGGSLSCLGGSL